MPDEASISPTLPGRVTSSGVATIAATGTLTLSVGEMEVELTGPQPVTVHGASMPSQVVITDHGGLTYVAQGGAGTIRAGLVDAAAGGSSITIPGFGFGAFDVGTGNDTVDAATGGRTHSLAQQAPEGLGGKGVRLAWSCP